MIDNPTFWMAVIDQLPATGGIMMNQDGAILRISRYPSALWVEVKAPIATGPLYPATADALLGEWCINRCGWESEGRSSVNRWRCFRSLLILS